MPDITITVEGMATEDLTARADVSTSIQDRSVHFLHPMVGEAKVTTLSRLAPGAKVKTPNSIRSVVPQELISEQSSGGGAFNVSTTLARINSDKPNAFNITFNFAPVCVPAFLG